MTRTGRPPRAPDALDQRLLGYLRVNGPQTVSRLVAAVSKTRPEALRAAVGRLEARGVVVVETRAVTMADGRPRVLSRVRLLSQALEDGHRLGEPREDPYADPDGCVPLWQRLDGNTRMSVELALPLLDREVAEVVRRVLDVEVWGLASEGYALHWLVIALADELGERDLLTYGVLRELFG